MKFDKDCDFIELDMSNIKKSFIYFFCQNDEVVYIGQTSCYIQRLMQHTNKIYNVIRIINCDINDLNEKEKEYIQKYKPKYNIQMYNRMQKKNTVDTSLVSKLAELSKCSTVTVYNRAKKLGRLPTLEELKQRKCGRPVKYTYQGD